MAQTQIDVEKLQDDIKKIKKLISEVEAIGGKMPGLKAAVDRLEFAVNTGSDIASAAEETSVALKEYTNDLYKACGDDFVCQAQVDRRWQARNVAWVLSWDKPDSTVRLFVRNTLRRYLPRQICQRLESCK
jgi:hypothetical protein